MKINERAACIRKLNPEACFAIEEKNGKQKIVYNKQHKGKKPTIKECEDVLNEVRLDMSKEASKEMMIRNKLREMAIAELKKEGKL